MRLMPNRHPLLLLALPWLVHLPALSGYYQFDPIYLVSGLAPGVWTSNGLLPGYPGWIDANAGVTTQALGALAAHDWLAGILPWWNPYAGVGMPLAAEGQTPAFFLPFVLLLARPHGLLLLRIVLLDIAGACTWALLRRMGMGALAAFVGAMLFELNGTFAWIAHGPALPVAFLPMMLLGVEQARCGHTPWGLTLGVLWTLLAGFPEVAALDLAFAAAWGAARLAATPRRLAWAALAGMAGGLIAAPGVWPFLQALPGAFVGKHGGVVTSGLRAGNAALLLFPGVLGAPLAAVMGDRATFALWWRAGGYCDLVLAALALAGLLSARLRGLRLLLLAWLVVTGLRAAAWPPAVALFGLVPLLRQVSVHVWVLPTWSMALSVLAALGVQQWRDGGRANLGRAALLLAPVACVALWLGLPGIYALWGRSAHYAAVLAFSLAFPVAILGGMLIVFYREYSPRRGEVLAALATINAAALFALPLLAGPHGRRIDAPSIRALQQAVGYGRVLPLGPLVPNYGAMYGIAELAHNAEPVPANWVSYVQRHLMPASDGVNFFEGSAPVGLAARLPAYEAAGASLAATYPGADPFIDAGNERPRRIYQGETMDLWRLPRPAPYFQAAGCMIAPVSRNSLTARCAGPAMLRRLELASRGWRATVNGVTAPVRTDAEIFQAVALPAGTSTVAFCYAPPGIEWSWFACAIGAGVIAIAMGWRDAGTVAGRPAYQRNGFPDRTAEG